MLFVYFNFFQNFCAEYCAFAYAILCRECFPSLADTQGFTLCILGILPFQISQLSTIHSCVVMLRKWFFLKYFENKLRLRSQ